eukprot:1120317-Prorocentrum_minimum.AAC.1
MLACLPVHYVHPLYCWGPEGSQWGLRGGPEGVQGKRAYRMAEILLVSAAVLASHSGFWGTSGFSHCSSVSEMGRRGGASRSYGASNPARTSPPTSQVKDPL